MGKNAKENNTRDQSFAAASVRVYVFPRPRYSRPAASPITSHPLSHARRLTCFAFFPRIFEEKIDLSCLMQLNLVSRAICFLRCSNVKTRSLTVQALFRTDPCEEEVPRRTKQLSAVAILFYQFLSCLVS